MDKCELEVYGSQLDKFPLFVYQLLPNIREIHFTPRLIFAIQSQSAEKGWFFMTDSFGYVRLAYALNQQINYWLSLPYLQVYQGL